MTKIRIIIILCSLFFLFGSIHLYAQKSTYIISAAGKKIGKINTSLVKLGDTETYEVVSEVDFKVLWTSYNRKTENVAVFENGILITSSSGVYMDHVLEDSSSMYLDENKYTCFRSPDQKFVLENQQLTFTTVMLYYNEPVGVEKIYSERFLDYCPIEKLDEHKYKIYLPNGKQNYYTYVNGILTEVFVDRTWFNLRFHRE
jgi:hypothetical protein